METPDKTNDQTFPPAAPKKTPKRSCKKCYGRGTLRVVLSGGILVAEVPCVCLKVRR